MTTPSTSPVPSRQPQDLLFNAEQLDRVINTSASTYTDRLGQERLTVKGAVDTIRSINARGGWAATTAYEAKDVVQSGGSWYIALGNHVSGATFAADQAAHWRLYQGVTTADLSSTAAGKGGSLVGLSDAGDLFPSAITEIEAAIQSLALSRKKLVDVSGYPWLADMTGATDSSAAVFAAQTYARGIGAGIYIPPGILQAAIDIHYSNAVIVGAGEFLTTIKLPTTQTALTSVAFSAGVGTVTCASTAGLWVGRSVRIGGTSVSDHNDGFVVTAVDSATQCRVTQLNAVKTGSSTGGYWMAANVIDCGELYNGNAAAAYSGLLLSGFTVDGQRSARPDPTTSDLTDWGVALTKFSHWRIVGVRGINCWMAGLAAFINSNYGHIQGYVENCGFSVKNPAGFEINSSKHFTFDIVSKDCANGIRLLDNVFNVTGRASIHNAKTIGAIFNNQSLNESHNVNVQVTVEGGCTSDGVQIGTNFRNSKIDATVSGVAGIGVREVYIATAANRPGGNRITATTRNCGLQGAKIGGDGSTWDCTSYMDGRSGAVGSAYAIEVDGSGCKYSANVTDSATPRVRGIYLSATSSKNRLTEFVRNGLVFDYQDDGSGNEFTPRQLRASKDYTRPSLASGAMTSTTIPVPGARAGGGDIANARYSQSPGGLAIFAEVTADDLVTAWITNNTGSAVSGSTAKLFAAVSTGSP